MKPVQKDPKASASVESRSQTAQERTFENVRHYGIVIGVPILAGSFSFFMFRALGRSRAGK